MAGLLTRRRKGAGDEVAKSELARAYNQHAAQEVDAQSLPNSAPFKRKPEAEQCRGWHEKKPNTPKEHR
jgi:hypothetical protein